MEIKEFKARKKQLEVDLHHAIAPVLNKFKTETNYHPESIYCDIFCDRAMGTDNEYILTGVKTEINI